MADICARIDAAVAVHERATISRPPRALDAAFDAHPWGDVAIDGAELAEFLKDLSARRPGSQVGIAGLHVRGPLALAWSELALAVDLDGCLLSGPVWLNDATIKAVRLSNCVAGAVDASRLEASQFIAHETLFVGRLSLSAARLGRVELTDSTLVTEGRGEKNATTLALDANVLTTTRSAAFNGKAFLCAGRARFIGAAIGGQLNWRDGVIVRRAVLAKARAERVDEEHLAAIAQRLATVDDRARRLVEDHGVVVPWHVPENPTNHETATRRDDDPEPCLSVHEATVDRSMYLHSTTCVGRVSLSAAHLGRLEARHVRLVNPGGIALDAANVVTRRDLDLSSGFVAGRVRGDGARVGRDLDLASLHVLAGGTDDHYVVSLPGCRVDLDLDATALSVTHAAHDPERATSPVKLLDLADGAVGSAFIWQDLELDGRAGHELRLTHLDAGRLADDRGSWAGVTAQLEGFRCRAMSFDGELAVGWRRTWLRDHVSPYAPQAYEQLATLAREQGREGDARDLSIASERDRRRRGGLAWPSRAWSWALDVTVGYGHRTGRALAALLVLWALGAGAYRAAWEDGAIQHDRSTVEGRCPADAPCFQPVVFSLDTLVPVVSLGQDSAWHVSSDVRRGPLYEWLQWSQIVLGWVLSTAVVAGAGRVLQRR